MNGYMMSSAMAEMAYKKRHSIYVLHKIRDHLRRYGVESLPGILAVLFKNEDGAYRTQAVRVYPDFVRKVIKGYDEYVAAFSYYHRLIRADYDESATETDIDMDSLGLNDHKVVVYCEDNLIKTTSYYNVIMDNGNVSIENQPFERKYNEFHPAMINMSNLYSVN